MEKFTVHTGVGVPLRRSNVDTDQIIPAEYLKRVTRHGYEDALFSAWRKDPDFVLNQPRYSLASVLVAGPDFGTGSSGNTRYGRCRTTDSRSFCRAGLLTSSGVTPGRVGWLQPRSRSRSSSDCGKFGVSPGAEITVDLVECRVKSERIDEPFVIDEYVRWRLLEGLDDIGISLKHEVAIEDFEARRPEYLPTTA